MINRFLIIAISMALGAVVGLYFSKRLTRRAAYFDALMDLVNLFLSEMKFRKTTTKQVVAEFRDNSKTPLNTNLTEYINCTDFSNLKLSKGLLTENERIDVKKFLLSLGTSDSHTQIFELENFKDRFLQMQNTAQEKRKKYASLYIKLGFLAGLALGIIII